MKSFFIFFLFPTCLLANAAPKAIELRPGHQKILATPNVFRASIGNAQIADVTSIPGDEKVIVTGMKVGTTDLVLWTKAGDQIKHKIHVRNLGPTTVSDAKELIKDIEGIALRKRGRTMTLEGTLYRGADLHRVKKLLKLYPRISNLTRIHPKAVEFSAGLIQSELERQGLEDLEVKTAGDFLFLTGEVSNASDSQRAQKIAHSHFPNIENHLLQGPSKEPLILMDVKLMEIRKHAFQEFGLDWPASISATGSYVLSQDQNRNQLGINASNSTSLTLKSLIEKGNGRVLSNPKLLCQSTNPCTFRAGGEIPIRSVGERVAEVVYKKYGLELSFQAQRAASERLQIEIRSRMSDLDPSTAVDGVPGFIENEVRTSANLRFGDTVVLAGLVESRARKNIRKTPFLGHIPILGELFKSRAFQKNNSEFLAFLTPLPAAPGTYFHKKALRKASRSRQLSQSDIQLSLWD